MDTTKASFQVNKGNSEVSYLIQLTLQGPFCVSRPEALNPPAIIKVPRHLREIKCLLTVLYLGGMLKIYIDPKKANQYNVYINAFLLSLL